MPIRLIQSPYDSGSYGTRMGLGPDEFLNNGLIDRLESLGREVTVATVDPHPGFPAEVATSFAVMRGIADEVRTAMDAGTFPFVLAGNCNTSVGTVSGLAPRDIGVVWFDAHGDFNTPETSTSGFIDGMGLAMLAGHCWQALATAIPGYAPVPENNVILVGARDFDDLEWERVSKSAMTYLSDQDVNNGVLEIQLGDPLDRLAARVDGVYLHLDLDVHDATVAPANHFRPPGGLTPERLQSAVAFIAARIPVLAAYIGSYDPDADPTHVTLQSGMALMETISSNTLNT